MKYCNQCGTQLVDAAVVCPKCGSASKPKPNPGARFQEPNQVRKTDSGMVIAVKIVLLLGAALTALTWYFIPLAWCIPMSIYYFKRVSKGQPVSVGFAICTMIFVSIAGGILMLCDNEHLAK